MLPLHMYACGSPPGVCLTAVWFTRKACFDLCLWAGKQVLVFAGHARPVAPFPSFRFAKWCSCTCLGPVTNRDPGKMYRCRCSQYAHCSACIVQLCMCIGLVCA